MLRSRYEIVKDINKEFSYKDWGIRVTNETIYFDKYRDKLILQLNIQNCSDKNIKKVTIKIRCTDEVGRILPEEIKYSYDFINIKPGNTFGEDYSIDLKNNRLKDIELFLEKIEFNDLSFIKYSNNEAIEFDTYSNVSNNSNTENINDLSFSLKQSNKYPDSTIDNKAQIINNNSKNKLSNQNKTEPYKSRDNYEPPKQNNLKNKPQKLSKDQQDVQKILASEKKKSRQNKEI